MVPKSINVFLNKKGKKHKFNEFMCTLQYNNYRYLLSQQCSVLKSDWSEGVDYF